MSQNNGVTEVLFLKAVVNAFLVQADVLTLIDTGTPGDGAKIVKALRAAGHEPADVERILVTHRHADHAGNAAELARLTGAEVHVSPADAPYVRDGSEQPRPEPATPLGRLMVPYVKVALPWKLEPVAVRETLLHGATVGPFRVVGTPGHTAVSTPRTLATAERSRPTPPRRSALLRDPDAPPARRRAHEALTDHGPRDVRRLRHVGIPRPQRRARLGACDANTTSARHQARPTAP